MPDLWSDLRRLLDEGDHTDGTQQRRETCSGAAQTHLLAAAHLYKTFQPKHVAVLQLEYALLQLANAIALVYDRSIENRELSSGTHQTAAQLVVAYCERFHSAVADDAMLAASLAARRNDYVYRHEPVTQTELKRLIVAVRNVSNAVVPDVMARSHEPLPSGEST